MNHTLIQQQAHKVAQSIIKKRKQKAMNSYLEDFLDDDDLLEKPAVPPSLTRLAPQSWLAQRFLARCNLEELTELKKTPGQAADIMAHAQLQVIRVLAGAVVLLVLAASQLSHGFMLGTLAMAGVAMGILLVKAGALPASLAFYEYLTKATGAFLGEESQCVAALELRAALACEDVLVRVQHDQLDAQVPAASTPSAPPTRL